MVSANNGVIVRPVVTRRDRNTFIKFPWSLYRDDPAWIPPLLFEEKKRLDPRKNPFFENGEGQCFLATRNGEVLGRISAQIDHLSNQMHNEQAGFFGFFEAVNDADVSNALLDRAAEWLRERGMTKIRGPFSWSINEESGLLIDGFEHPPRLLTAHHPPYYQRLLEEWGLSKAKDLYCWNYSAFDPVPEAGLQIANVVKEHQGLKVRELDWKNYERDIKTIFDIFNSAWQSNWGFVPMTDKAVEQVSKELKLILDERVVYIAEVDGQPAAICVCFMDLNEAIRDLNGRLFPFGFAKLLYRLKRRKVKWLRLIMLGVKKEYRGSILGGLSVLLYTELHQRAKDMGYHGAELSWTLEDNDKINMGIQMMGGKHYKTYRVYEKGLGSGAGSSVLTEDGGAAYRGSR